MTVPIALVVGLVAGSAIAWIARGPLRETAHPLRTRYGAVALLMGLAGIMPASVSLLALEPAWALMYLAHPVHARVLVWPVALFGLAGAPLIGLKVSHGLLSEHAIGRWWVWMGGLTGLFLFALVAGVARLGTVGTYENFYYGAESIALTASSLFWPVMVTSLFAPLLVAYCLVQVQRHVDLIENVPTIDSDEIPFEVTDPPVSAV